MPTPTRRRSSPRSRNAVVHILFEGYAEPGVASTVGYIRDARAHIVVDPGMVPSPRVILNPLRRLGVAPRQVTDVVFSHHHPDHTLHAALFPNARFHDHWAIYKGDRWESRKAEGFLVSPHVRLLETPGHTPQDITTLVDAQDGPVAFTHLWWGPDGPVEDPYAPDPALLHRNRARVLGLARRIVPGHGPAFVPGPDTPR
jgi:glyoxylase-like metal-dependent hydrolase (beta-lactamase superfamily II)